MKLSPFLIFFVSATVMILSSCGGGGGTGTDGGTFVTQALSVDSSSPTLEDGGHFARFGLLANSSNSTPIKVGSSSFDAMFVVEKIYPDGTSEVIAEDDDGDGGTNAKSTINVVAGTSYTVIVSSASGDASGSATVTYDSNVMSADGRGKAAAKSVNKK